MITLVVSLCSRGIFCRLPGIADSIIYVLFVSSTTFGLFGSGHARGSAWIKRCNCRLSVICRCVCPSFTLVFACRSRYTSLSSGRRTLRRFMAKTANTVQANQRNRRQVKSELCNSFPAGEYSGFPEEYGDRACAYPICK